MTVVDEAVQVPVQTVIVENRVPVVSQHQKHLQNLEPDRRHGRVMMNAPDCRSCQIEQSQAHMSRSAIVSFGRFTDRWRTANWLRSARISS
jgi:hypothetical protein